MNIDRGNPILLSASITLTPGQTGIPDMEALTNMNQRAMLIDEVRFSFYSDLIASIDQTAWLGAIVRVQLEAGGYEICKDFVPIWSFARATDTRNELNPNSNFTGLTVANSAQFFRWVPPSPIYIPIGSSITPMFQLFNPQIATDLTGVTVSVGFAGRELLSPLQGKMRVPWVSAFIRDDLSITAFDEISNEKNLQNPFNDKMLDLHRFNFRAYAQNGAGEGEISEFCNVKLRDSLNNDIIPRLSASDAPFALSQRTWETPGVQLDPKQWLVAEVAYPSTGTAIDAEDAGFALTMFGSREENF